MVNELVVQNSELTAYKAEQAVAKMTANGNYTVSFSGMRRTLERDIDFGVIPGTKSPSLYKAGAEKICLAYGLVPHISLESKTEEWKESEKGEELFFGLYTMKCELHKIGPNGVDYIIASGYGSANTFEKRNGWNKGKPDAINSSIKMAAKRAMVGTVLSISGLSSMFTQDIEDADFETKANKNIAESGEFVDNKTVLKLINDAVRTGNGMSKKKVQEILKSGGYAGEKGIQIKKEDYEKVEALLGLR